MMTYFRSPKGLLILTLALYAVTVTFPFIALDDSKHIWQNPYVMSLSKANLAHFWAAPYYGLYIPMVYSFWSVLAAITQSLGLKNEITVIQAPLFHFANMLFHLLNVYLVWNLFAFWFSRTNGSAEDRPRSALLATLAAATFAIHPLQVEAVAWASGLKDTLSGFFALLALHGFCAHFFSSVESKRKKFELPNWPLPSWCHRHSRKLWFLGCALAYVTKPSTIVLPLAAGALTLVLNRQSFKRSLKWLWLPLAGAVFLVTITKQVQPDARLDFQLELWQRPLVALASLGFYIVKVLIPYPLLPDYGLSPDRLLAMPRLWIFYVVAALALGIFLWAVKRKQAFLLIGLLLIGIGFAPVLGLIPFEFQNLSTVADRYFYLFPAMGSGFVIAFLASLSPRFSTERILPVLLLAWLPLSFLQVMNWANNDHLFRHTTRFNPRSYLAWNNIGLQEVRRGEFEPAIEHFGKALEAKPDYLAAISNLGVVYFKKNDFAKTIEHYQRYLAELPPAGPGSPATFADMYFNLGAAQVNLQKLEDAERNLRQAVIINPDHFLAHFHLGRLLAARGNREGAKAELLQAYRLQPNDKGVQAELMKLGR